jgi:hypothetical protein
MITETKLRAALDRLGRKQGTKAGGRPMSGLSIPAEYYFGRPKAREAQTARSGEGPLRVEDGQALFVGCSCGL